MGPRLLVVVLAMAGAAAPLSSQSAKSSVDELMSRVATYAANYGEKASLIVAVEKYIQRFGGDRPRQVTAEFAIVKAPGGWVGYRDVVEVNGEKISDRRDRLMSIFTDPAADSRMIRKLTEESSRFNIGPISRNFNVPTTVMLVFLPVNLHRFVFTLKGQDRIDGVVTQEVAFKEVGTPTLTMTRAGRNVPMEGSLWVTPADGAVVRTRMRMRNFADTVTSAKQGPGAPQGAPQVDTTRPTAGRVMPTFDLEVRPIEASAEFAVTYAWHKEFEMWLPRTMVEQYEGPIRLENGPPVTGRASTNATYSDFKSFQTGTKINVPQ